MFFNRYHDRETRESICEQVLIDRLDSVNAHHPRGDASAVQLFGGFNGNWQHIARTKDTDVLTLSYDNPLADDELWRLAMHDRLALLTEPQVYRPRLKERCSQCQPHFHRVTWTNHGHVRQS